MQAAQRAAPGRGATGAPTEEPSPSGGPTREGRWEDPCPLARRPPDKSECAVRTAALARERRDALKSTRATSAPQEACTIGDESRLDKLPYRYKATKTTR